MQRKLGGPKGRPLGSRMQNCLGFAAAASWMVFAAAQASAESARPSAAASNLASPPSHGPNPQSSYQAPPDVAARLYVPFAFANPICRQVPEPVDVVLVMDRSTSMLQPVEPGGTAKTVAAIAAAHTFVDLLRLTPDSAGRRDQVAIVGFNQASWTAVNLTNDRRAAHAALNQIAGQTREGTRLDLAFAGGQQALTGPTHRAENRPLMIVLTDGLPNGVPFGPGSPYPSSSRQEDSVLIAAAAAKKAGTRIHTIGLGSEPDILPWLLEASASSPALYQQAPRPEDLRAIYVRIATTRADCLPRPTAAPPTVRPSPTPIPTRTPRPTDTPSPSPTPCPPRQANADVSIVLDMSTSMQRVGRDGQTKVDAAINGARNLVRRMRFSPDAAGEHDQVAISGFNGSSWTTQGLTNVLAAAETALDAQSRLLGRGTRIDLGFGQAQAALDAGPRRAANRPVIILLTDGSPSGVPPGPGGTQNETVLAEADKAKRAGTLIFTIGLGLPTEIDEDLLRAAASTPSMYFYAPDGADLDAIYKQIAVELVGCP